MLMMSTPKAIRLGGRIGVTNKTWPSAVGLGFDARGQEHEPQPETGSENEVAKIIYCESCTFGSMISDGSNEKTGVRRAPRECPHRPRSACGHRG